MATKKHHFNAVMLGAAFQPKSSQLLALALYMLGPSRSSLGMCLALGGSGPLATGGGWGRKGVETAFW